MGEKETEKKKVKCQFCGDVAEYSKKLDAVWSDGKHNYCEHHFFA